MSNWISVRERLPEPGVYVLGYSRRHAGWIWFLTKNKWSKGVERWISLLFIHRRDALDAAALPAKEPMKSCWIPLAERRPEPGQRVRVKTYAHSYFIMTREEIDDTDRWLKQNGLYKWYRRRWGRDTYIQYWMPYPDPPKANPL